MQVMVNNVDNESKKADSSQFIYTIASRVS